MIKKTLALICCICAVFAAVFSAGCGRDYLKMPDDPLVFRPFTFEDVSDDPQGFEAITYSDRTYVVYGTLRDSLKLEEVVSEVLGYRYSENAPDDRSELVIKLNGTDDYLMVYYVDAFMQPPMFYRAWDTAGQDIFTPDYIESFGDGIWD